MNLSSNLRRHLAAGTLVGLLALGAVGCSAAGAETDPAAGDASAVVVDQMAFSPETLTVPAGTTVTWTWDSGGIAHDVVGEDFASKIQSDGTFSHRFDEPGTYTYVCTLHPSMTATIEVVP